MTTNISLNPIIFNLYIYIGYNKTFYISSNFSKHYRTPYSVYNTNNTTLQHAHSHQNIWLDKRSHDRIQHWLSEQHAYTGYPPPETESVLSLRSASSICDAIATHPLQPVPITTSTTFSADDNAQYPSSVSINNTPTVALTPLPPVTKNPIFPKYKSEEFLPVTYREQGNSDQIGTGVFNNKTNKRYNSPNCIRRRYVSPRSDPALDTIGNSASVPARSVSCRNLWPGGSIAQQQHQIQQQQEGGASGAQQYNNITYQTFYQSGGVNTFPRRRAANNNKRNLLGVVGRYNAGYQIVQDVDDNNAMGQQLEKYHQQRVLLNPYASSAATIERHEIDNKKGVKGGIIDDYEQNRGDITKEKPLFVDDTTSFTHCRTFVLNGINLQQQQQHPESRQQSDYDNNNIVDVDEEIQKSSEVIPQNNVDATPVAYEENHLIQKTSSREIRSVHSIENDSNHHETPVPTAYFHERVASAPATTDSRHLQRDTYWRGEVAHRKISHEVRKVKAYSWPKRAVLPEDAEHVMSDWNSTPSKSGALNSVGENTSISNRILRASDDRNTATTAASVTSLHNIKNIDSDDDEDVPPARPPLPPEHMYSKRGGGGGSSFSSVATPQQQQLQQQQHKNNTTQSQQSTTSIRSSNSHIVDDDIDNTDNDIENDTTDDKHSVVSVTEDMAIVPVTVTDTYEQYYDIEKDKTSGGVGDVTRAVSESGYVTTSHQNPNDHRRNRSNEQLLHHNHLEDYSLQNCNGGHGNNKSVSACELSRKVSMSLRDLIRIHEKEIARVSGAVSTRGLDKIEESGNVTGTMINNNTMASYSMSTQCVKGRGEEECYYDNDDDHLRHHQSSKWKRHTTIGLLGDYTSRGASVVSGSELSPTAPIDIDNSKNRDYGRSPTSSLMSPSSSMHSRNFNFNTGYNGTSPRRTTRRRETSETGGEHYSASNLPSPRSPKNVISTLSSAASNTSRSNLNLRHPPSTSLANSSPPVSSPPPPHTLLKPKRVTTTCSVLTSPSHAIEQKANNNKKSVQTDGSNNTSTNNETTKQPSPVRVTMNRRHSRDDFVGGSNVSPPSRDFTDFVHEMHDTAVQTEQESDLLHNNELFDHQQKRYANVQSPSLCNDTAVQTHDTANVNGGDIYDISVGEDQFDNDGDYQWNTTSQQNPRHSRTPSFLRNEQLVNELSTEKEKMQKAFDEERRDLNKKLLEQQKVANAYQKLEDRYRKKVYELQRAMKMCTCASGNRFFASHNHEDQNHRY